MRINKKNQSFGWFYGTHKGSVSYVLAGLENLKPYETQLREKVIQPDFDETGIFSRLHFFDMASNKSYLDFDGKQNAFVRYKKHVKKMLYAIDEMKPKTYIEHAGRALHFLQDMTQPQHTQKVNFWHKIMFVRSHLDFEGFVKEHQEMFFASYQHRKFVDKPFNDLFVENVHQSTNAELPNLGNRQSWEGVGIDAMHQTLSSTREFLSKLNLLIEQKKNAIENKI